MTKARRRIERLQAELARLLKAEEDQETRRALRLFPIGCTVRLTCKCGRGSAWQVHSGVWVVDGYSPDAGDFHLVRPGDPTTTDYATRRAMERA